LRRGRSTASVSSGEKHKEKKAMKTGKSAAPVAERRIFHAGMVCAVALVSFASGSLLPVRLTRLNEANADSQRVFELLIYHAVPGKGPALEALFRDASKLMAKHGVDVVGYWVPNEDPAWNDTFVYLVAHPSRDEATKNWQALHADTEFRPYRESAKPLLQKPDEKYKVDEVYMRPTDFSAMR
jgi:NIPSNAP